MKKIGMLLTLCLALIMTACTTTLSSVHSSLDSDLQRSTSLASDGSYIAITMTRSCSRSDESILCRESHALDDILDGLGFESNVRRRMGETRALDGRQTAESGHFNVSWTFHPDNGLQVLFESN